MLIFYDFEVYKYDWIVVLINPIEQKQTVIYNNKVALELFHETHKDDIWVGYNSRSYDQYILKGIILGFDPYEINDWIIRQKRKGWEYSSMFNTIQLYNYDCMPSKDRSLKQLEGFMGNNMKETSVPFDIDRKLTGDELVESIKYCKHDVEQTMEVFIKNKSDFDAHIQMIKTFHLPFKNISKTKAQLSALALGCVKHDWFDEWDYSIIDTLQISKYKQVIEWYEMQKEVRDYDAYMKIDICGVPHVFGWGGSHGAIDHPVHRKGLLIHVDVTSFYPSIMIEYDMLSRNVSDKAVYKQIYDTRVALKAAGKKKEQAPYKIILNATFGICKDQFNNAYDPRRANEVCVNGQLLLIDLLEHLEGHCELIQSNTDGLIIQIPDTDEAFNTIDDICYEWEQRTHMKLGFDILTEIWQKDVNNYIFRFENGKLERKGAYVMELNDLDNDLPIINTALVDYMTRKIEIEDTIMQCNDLKQFQKLYKISSAYECAWHNGMQLQEKTFRVFASKDEHDTFMGKMKLKNGKLAVEKFANTPDHCFIDNGDINGKKVPDNLDRQYYIDLAKKRLKQFGMLGNSNGV